MNVYMKCNKVLILFPDTWLSYSPSIINLTKVMIEGGWQVTVIAVHDGSFHKTTEINVSYIVPTRVTRKLVGVLKLFSIYRFVALSVKIFKLRNHEFDLVIGVDSLGYLIARLFFENPVYYSLHIRKVLSTYLCKKLRIERMIIQTSERLDITVKNMGYSPADVWFIQNSPILERPWLSPIRHHQRKFKLVYFGNVAKNTYGIENCIETLHYVPDDVTLTLKGPLSARYRNELEDSYGKFISMGRLTFDSEYIAQDKVIGWLKGFDLGFCFYDEEEIRRGNPNIISAPSGKLFNYLAASVPVIGSKISGLQILSEFGAGILLDGQDPKKIGAAVSEIRSSYETFSLGCKQAAMKNDFRVMAESFLADLVKHNVVS